ncbi:hypothetical protein [[Eubacterium] cellulosolvens]
MASTYTSLTAAIASLLAGTLWGLMGVGVDMMTGRQSPQIIIVFAISVLVAWILIPFYLKRVKAALLGGIIVAVIALVGLAANPGTPPWYTFTNPVFDFSFVVFYLVLLAFIYFSYKSYRELK